MDRESNRQEFFAEAEALIRSLDKEKNWCMMSIDIDNLKLFNKWYGRESGDLLLTRFFARLKKWAQEDGEVHGIAGYFGNDDFALLAEADESKVKRLYAALVAVLEESCSRSGFMPTIGVYAITDFRDSAFTMYDHAELARNTIRENYRKRICWFNREMLDVLESKYLLYSDVTEALKNKNFIFVLQPKCNMETGKIIGAEALVRWISKEKGIISPGVFIPLLERTGAITELDTYVWESVCMWQRSMLDRGLPTVPVSVNVSRIDIFSMDIADYFSRLLKKYDLQPSLIDVEITESVYTEDYDMVGQAVKRLRHAGIHVHMDDFGSGYSSLNMLKDIEIDVLKIDMQFLEMNDVNKGKGIGILKTIQDMASLLGIDVIAEGVETEAQKEFLLRMGCTYGQGYYFYRPLDVTVFETIISNTESWDDESFDDRKIDRLYLKDILKDNMFSEGMVNNLLGAVVFFDREGSRIQVKRYNGQFARLAGSLSYDENVCREFMAGIFPQDYEQVLRMFDRAENDRDGGSETDFRWQRPDGEILWLHQRTFFLSHQGGHQFFYSSVTDVTDVYRKNEILTQQNQVLRFLNNDMPGGYYRHKYNAECDFTHISERFLEIVGYSREEIKRSFDDKFINMVHPDDRNFIFISMKNMDQNGGNYSQSYRMRSKQGYITVLDQSRLVKINQEEFLQGIILTDVHYNEQFNEEKDFTEKMPCGIIRSEVDGEHNFAFVSESLLSILGYTREAFFEKFKNERELIFWKDRERVHITTIKQMKRSSYICCDYRIEMADGSLKWVYSCSRIINDSHGKRWYYECITDYDYAKSRDEELNKRQIKYQSITEIPGMMIYDYDPQTDRMNIELRENNGAVILIEEKFFENIDHHDWLAGDMLLEQKDILREASQKAMSGSMVFRANFLNKGFKWYRAYFTSLADEHGKVFRIVGRADDVEIEMETMSNWKDRAMKDSLTGLLNHESAKDITREALKKFSGGTLFLLDVDNFKEINDTYGHLRGDTLLKHVGEILSKTFRSDDILGRIGGDEFMMCMPGVYDEELASFKAESIMAKLRNFYLSDQKNASCSIGAAICKHSDTDCEDMINRADEALYCAKRRGKDQFALYEDQEYKNKRNGF